MINYSELRHGMQIFSWQSAGSQKIEHYAVTFLNEYLEITRFPTSRCLLTDHLVEAAWKNGIEEIRLQQITLIQIAKPITLLAQETGDHQGTHVVADGNHRLIMLHRAGFREFLAWMVPEKIWKEFRIVNLPEERGALRPGFQNQRQENNR